MDLEDDTHMNTSLGTTTVQEVINVPIMISPELYDQVASVVMQRLITNHKAFYDVIDVRIQEWMDRKFDLSDYNTDGIRDDILDAVRYDLKNSIRAEVEIYVD
jgi:hypothetical protein